MKPTVLRSLFISFFFVLLFVIEVPTLVLARPSTLPGRIDRRSLIKEKLPLQHQFSSFGLGNTSPYLPPTGLEDWSRIVFQSFRDNNWEIYFSTIDCQNPINLSNHPQVDSRPNLNRGGTRIAFDSSRDGNAEIYTIQVNGLGLTRLTYNDAADYAPAWSPDGNKLVFVSERDSNGEIYKVNADGSSITRLTFDPQHDTSPTWSPDGSQIAWVRHSIPFGSIWIMNTDGSNAHPIINDLKYLGRLAWSPDGTRLAFDYDYDNDEWNELVWIYPDGTGWSLIYDSGEHMVDSWMGSWSPDSQWLLFSRVEYIVDNNELYFGNTYLEKIKLGPPSTDHTRLIGSGYDLEPVWQTLDVDPPTSQVDPLPKYTRVGEFPVHWTGIDNGLAGISSYDLQYRANASGNWNNWAAQTGTTNTTGIFTAGSAGTEMYFRSRARDRAENLEAWPTWDADAWTKLFSWLYEISIYDNRGKPVADPAILISPNPWESKLISSSGDFLFHLIAEGNHTISAHHTGYGTLPSVSLSIDSDSYSWVHLPPEDNLIQNGEFESDYLEYWLVDGTAHAIIDDTQSHSGNNSLQLGYSPDIPISNLSNSSDLSGNFGYPQIVKDSQGILHAVWHDMSHSGLVYSRKNLNGAWTSPTLIAPGINQYLAIGPDDTLHLVWMPVGYSEFVNVSYASKPANSAWSTYIDLSGSFASPYPNATATLAIDELGSIHVIWADQEHGLMYTTRTQGSSTWSVPNAIFPNGVDPALAVGQNQHLHLIWRHNSDLFYSSRSSSGTWDQPLKISDDAIGFFSETLFVDEDGITHLSWLTNQHEAIKYAWKSPIGVWSTPVEISEVADPDFITYGGISLGSDGYLHLAWSTYFGDVYYRVRYPGDDWSIPFILREGECYAPRLLADDQGVVHIVWYENYPYYTNTEVLYTSYIHPQIMDVNTSQSIHIGEDIYKPTLSLVYRFDPYNGSGANIQASINGAPVVTVTNPTHDWIHDWVDLSSWSGQTVTLTFTSHGSATKGYTFAHFDEISLGSWSTPVIHSVVPQQFDVWASKTFTVTGENFISTPIVYLDDQIISGVIILDGNTLQVVLPAGLSPGMYDIWVENPGGQRAVLTAGLRLGKSVYLPLVQR